MNLDGQMDFHFLIASERSGSNLITKMLDAHPDVCGPSPLHILRMLGMDHYRYGNLKDPAVWTQFLDDMHVLLSSEFATWATSFTREELDGMAEVGDLPALVRAVFTKEAEANGKKAVFIKELWAYRYLPFLEWCFPGAKYVYLVRDPRDMALSWRKNDTHPGGLVAGARQWLKDQSQTLPNFGSLLNAGRGVMVRYEDLVSNSEKELTRICELLDIPYHADMLKFHESDLTKQNAEKNPLWENLAKEVMSDNFGKFKKTLNAKEIAIIERICWNVLQYFGYQPFSSIAQIKAVDNAMINNLDLAERKAFRPKSTIARPHDRVQNRLRRISGRYPGL